MLASHLVKNFSLENKSNGARPGRFISISLSFCTLALFSQGGSLFDKRRVLGTAYVGTVFFSLCAGIMTQRRQFRSTLSAYLPLPYYYRCERKHDLCSRESNPNEAQTDKTVTQRQR